MCQVNPRTFRACANPLNSEHGRRDLDGANDTRYANMNTSQHWTHNAMWLKFLHVQLFSSVNRFFTCGAHHAGRGVTGSLLNLIQQVYEGPNGQNNLHQ